MAIKTCFVVIFSKKGVLVKNQHHHCLPCEILFTVMYTYMNFNEFVKKLHYKIKLSKRAVQSPRNKALTFASTKQHRLYTKFLTCKLSMQALNRHKNNFIIKCISVILCIVTTLNTYDYKMMYMYFMNFNANCIKMTTLQHPGFKFVLVFRNWKHSGHYHEQHNLRHQCL